MQTLILLAFVALVSSTTYRIGTNPSDLQKALGKVKGGDEIVLTTTVTVYYQSHTTAKSRIGSPSAPITIRGENGRGVIRSKNKYNKYCFFLQYSRYWVIKDFTCTGFLKGIVLEGSKYGYMSGVTVTDSGTEAFKFRYFTHYWLVENCKADGAGKKAKNYGEGFYVGQADNNWRDGKKDTSGYITFKGCSTKNTYNDGWDIKEGSGFVKVKNCYSDFSGIRPKKGDYLGYSGVFIRGNDVQIIGFTLKGAQDYHIAVRMYTTSYKIGGKCYGDYDEATNVKLQGKGSVYDVYKKFSCTHKTIYKPYTTSSGRLWADSKKTTTIKSGGFKEKTWKSDGVKVNGQWKYSSSEESFGAEMLVIEPPELDNWEDLNTGDHGCIEGRKMGSVCCPIEGGCDKRDILNGRKMCHNHTAPCVLEPDEWEDEEDTIPVWVLSAGFAVLVVTGLTLLVGAIKFFNRRSTDEPLEYQTMNSVVLSDDEETL